MRAGDTYREESPLINQVQCSISQELKYPDRRGDQMKNEVKKLKPGNKVYDLE